MNTQLIHNLPFDFFQNNHFDCAIYFYNTQQSSKNIPVTFTHNVLCFLLNGHKEVISNQNNISIQNDQFFLLQSGNSLMTERLIGDSGYNSILFFFSDHFLNEILSKKQIELPKTMQSNQTVLNIHKDTYINLFEKSLLLLKNEFNKAPYLTSIKLEEILFYLLSKEPERITNFFKNTLSRHKNKSIKDIIQQYEDSHLTIEELAFLSNMSISTFKRKFAEIYQISPKKYFISKRMEKARNELILNKRPSDLYHELGYENLSAFSNEFKKYYGVSPKNFKMD
ncbi:hypothetical protein AX766_01625 [Flavobacterium covae]|uniref:AraC family transcriptional regulator n=2 Tax=Flavobacterium TaxID=237 RepID=A0AA94F0V3_9FLAO|nr:MULTISPECIES: AraC family transcriptional regulator [Flavobacterium]OXA80497.1 AraC family transcriptional regulator [Flavobacterium columnare NBRC 100251 = ATCC 23463]AND63215.1 hypothetical protein AX766_01625 [Flavobacterium covae]MCH4828796.1 helix-turn-helix transcriptional regulator [Flavobacterium columnare]MCH4832050.1 helix-turn-helix transcriptional regulator [Flavobacterium columnare]MCJ1806225.1 AraC family transcriptional regulator [Flavobacterium covae]